MGEQLCAAGGEKASALVTWDAPDQDNSQSWLCKECHEERGEREVYRDVLARRALEGKP